MPITGAVPTALFTTSNARSAERRNDPPPHNEPELSQLAAVQMELASPARRTAYDARAYRADVRGARVSGAVDGGHKMTENLAESTDFCHKERAGMTLQRHPALTINRNGDATMARPIPTPIPDDVKARFWAKVDMRGPDDCWNWQASRNRGYGRFCIGHQKMVPAHRFSFVLAGGCLPETLVIDHLCRNPSCVNPRHMEPVSNGENVRRGVAGKNGVERGLATTHCPRGHEYTADNTYLNRKGHRGCRTCGIQRNRDRRRSAGLKGIASGEAHGMAKFTNEQVAAIRASTLSSRAAARLYGISDSYVRALRRGRRP